MSEHSGEQSNRVRELEAEMEQLRAELTETQQVLSEAQGAIGWQLRQHVTDRDGDARVISRLRAALNGQEHRLTEFLGAEHPDPVSVVIDRCVNAEREQAVLRERAETAIDLIDEYDGPEGSFEDHPKWAAVRDALRASPRPITPRSPYGVINVEPTPLHPEGQWQVPFALSPAKEDPNV